MEPELLNSCSQVEVLKWFKRMGELEDMDKVVEQINDLVKPTAQYRHNFCGTVTDEHCVKYDGCESCMAEQICKVVKSGGIE